MILSLGLVVPQAQVPTRLELTIPHFGHRHESEGTVFLRADRCCGLPEGFFKAADCEIPHAQVPT